MRESPAEREAKEFVVGRILEQANIDGVTLSEAERAMLFYSIGTEATLRQQARFEEFEQNYDSLAYEAKITGLATALQNRLR